MSNSDDIHLKRRLAAIMVADVVGYSLSMSRDEEGTFTQVRHLMREEVAPRVLRNDGRIVKTLGDGIVAEFASAVNAVRAGVEIQEMLAGMPSKPGPNLSMRVGINFGDIIIDADGDVFGDGVNVAARLEQMAAPGGICLSGKVYEEVRDKLRLQLEYFGEQQLKNIPRPVAVYTLFNKPVTATPLTMAHPTASTKPYVFVRPFTSSGDVQAYFRDGFTEDLVTELTRFTQLTVASHHTSTQLKDVELGALASEFGVHFVVEGSMRRMGQRLRISCQLVDAASGEGLWAERFDRKEEEIFDIHDELVGTIVGTLIGRLKAAGAEKARRKPPANLEAYECVLRGNALPMGDIVAETEARRLYERAIELDPTYGRAYAKLAHYRQLEWFRDMGASDAVLGEALYIAKKAVALAPNDPVCLNILGWVLLHRREFAVAEQLYNRALELNPNDPEQISYVGTFTLFAGEPDRAMQWFERAQVLDPLYDPSWYWPFRGVTHFVAHRFEPAIVALGRSPTMPIWVMAYLAAANALLQRSSEASAYAELVVQNAPDFSANRFAIKEPYRLEDDRNTLLAGMLKSGLPG